MGGYSRISLLLLLISSAIAIEIATSQFVAGEEGWVNITANGTVDIGILHERDLVVEANAFIENGTTTFGGKGYFVYHLQKDVNGTLPIKLVPKDQQEIILVVLFNESGNVGFKVSYHYAVLPAEAAKENYFRILLIILALLTALMMVLEYLRRECAKGKKWKICEIFAALKRKIFKRR